MRCQKRGILTVFTSTTDYPQNRIVEVYSFWREIVVWHTFLRTISNFSTKWQGFGDGN